MTRCEWRPARVVLMERAASDMVALGVRPDLWIPHRAGQHYELRFPGEELSRKFSLVSSPQHREFLEFGLQIRSSGMLTPRLARCRPGDRLEVRGPTGVAFAWEPSDGGPLVLLGAGAGITPLLGIRDDYVACGIDRSLVFVVSARTPERVYRLDRNRNALTLRYTAQQGRIDRAYLSRQLAGVLGDPATRARVCGPSGFITAMVESLIELGIDGSRIRSESFA